MNTPQFELRASADGKRIDFDGYAALTAGGYGVREAARSFEETIERGAFKRTLGAGADVVLAVEHGPPFIARTPKTLQLREDGKGLRVTAKLDPSDPDVQATVSKIRAGILPEMSFSFRVPAGGDTWSSDGTKRTVTTLDMNGGDVSVVRTGANRSTSVSVRGRPPGAFEVRSSGLIAFRQDGSDDTYDDGDEEQAVCPTCGGSGTVGTGANARTCPLCDGSGVVSEDDEDDGDTQTHVGRALGLASAIPDTWVSDGGLKRSRTTVADLEVRAARAKSRAVEARFVRDYGDQLARTEIRHLTEAGRLASEALRRGDARSASLWMRQEAAELDALAAEL